MAYEIVERELTPRQVLVARRQVPHSGIGAALSEALPLVVQFAARHHLTLGGRPFVRYLEVKDGTFTLEAGMPVIGGEAPAATVDPSGVAYAILPGGPAATTVHVGPYDSLGEAYRALERWIAAHRRAPAGAPWEDYISDPGTTADPGRYETAISWPLIPSVPTAGVTGSHS